MLKVGMVGCGEIAQVHARGWLTLETKAVVTAVSETEVAVETLVSIRDRVIQAYEEIMKMPI